jgi:two-component system sensor kinase FixL
LKKAPALSTEAIIVTRLDGSVVSWSPGAERMFGFLAQEMRERPLVGVIADERSGELGAIFDRIRSGSPIEDVATIIVTRAGARLDVTLDALPIPDDDGRVRSAVVVLRDRAERNLAAALHESEGRWRAVMDAAVDAVIVIDARGAIEEFNPAAERLFGYAAAEMSGRNVSMLMPEATGREHDSYIAEYLRTGREHIIGIGREVTARRRDGSTFPVHLAVGEMALRSGRHFIGILHDLTARVELETRVREQTALARLGEMAAVIAHEVKNPLAAVRGAIQVIGSRLPEDSRDRPVIAEILARIDALNALIKDLLLFARTPQPRFGMVDLSSLLRITAAFLSADPGLSNLRFDIVGHCAPIDGDAEFLRIVFENLLLNAAQAMQGQGVVAVLLTARDDVQEVAIVDHGPGLSPQARDNLFRPFFTTKARGTGLGLATAKRLIDLHSGSIAVNSVAGRTTVTVTVPAAASHPPADRHASQAT